LDSFLASQILVGLAFGCGVISLQCRHRRTILLWMAVATVLNASHFFLLDRDSAGTLYLIMCARLLTASVSTDRRWMIVFGIAVLAAAAATYERPLDALALAAALVATYAAFQVTARRLRLAYLACAATWIVHNILAGSPVAVVMEATFLVSNAVGFWRHHRRPVSGTPELVPKS
jgi:hypothetical protein